MGLSLSDLSDLGRSDYGDIKNSMQKKLKTAKIQDYLSINSKFWDVLIKISQTFF